ncbi:Tn3 family transposase [Streptomyces viridosporus]|uniref:recombinase family protein n=1 Tax=Streptomyces viridosporus TaxID=67581 RepID=UPI003D9EE8B7
METLAQGAVVQLDRAGTRGADAARPSVPVSERQLDSLTAAACRKIFADKKSGRNALRPELKACHTFLDAGDTLLVPSLGRYGRSLQDLINMVAELRERGIGFTPLYESLDTTTPGGRLVFHVFRTVQLLRYLSDAPLRRRVTAATNKVESFNRFSQWAGFGNRGVIADNDPIEQEKSMKFNALLTNMVIFHNAPDIAEIIRQLLEEGWEIDPEDLAHISPYLTEHVNRFGEYNTHELGIQPEAYDPKLDVDFTPLREQSLIAAGLGQAA